MTPSAGSETPHTPGPWRLEDFCVLVGEPGEYKHSECGTPLLGAIVADCQSNPLGKKASKANARLIAAAPDLLAACEVAREELRLLQMKDTSAVYDPTVRARLDIAIRKAKGTP